MKPDAASLHDAAPQRHQVDENDLDLADWCFLVSLLVIQSRQNEMVQYLQGRSSPLCLPGLPVPSKQGPQGAAAQQKDHTEEIQKHLRSMLRTKVSVCIEALILPNCPHGKDQAGHVILPSQLPQAKDYLLLEQWNMNILARSSGKGTQLSSRGVVQAIKSYLHFSQLSAWLHQFSKLNACNTAYRISPTGDFCTHTFEQPPEVHQFPECNIRNMVVSMTVAALPRLDAIPAPRCSKCQPQVPERTAAAACRLEGGCYGDHFKQSQIRPKPSENGVRSTRNLSIDKSSQTSLRHFIAAKHLYEGDQTYKSMFESPKRESYLQHNPPSCSANFTQTVQGHEPTNLHEADYHQAQHREPPEEQAQHREPPGEQIQHREPHEKQAQLKEPPGEQFQHRKPPGEPFSPEEQGQYREPHGEQIQHREPPEEQFQHREPPEEQVQLDELPETEWKSRPDASSPLVRHAQQTPSNSFLNASSELKPDNVTSFTRNKRKSAPDPARYPSDGQDSFDLGSFNVVFDIDNDDYLGNGTPTNDDEGDVFQVHSAYTPLPKSFIDSPQPACVGSASSPSQAEYSTEEECVFTNTVDEPSTPRQSRDLLRKCLHKTQHTHKPQVNSSLPLEVAKAKFNSSPSSKFHPLTGLPMQSSPAPMKKISSMNFGYDCTLSNPKAIKSSLSCMSLSCNNRDENDNKRSSSSKMYSTSAPASTNSLLGNFEESVLNGRIEPSGVLDGFHVDIGASGSFCPKHVLLPATTYFFRLSDDNAPSPYLGHVELESLGKRGYHVPAKGTIQVTLFNPNNTVVKMFVVLYDLTDMPPSCQTFLRQRTVYMPVKGSPSDVPENPIILRHLVHLRFASSHSNKIYLHSDIRLIFSQDHVEYDPKVASYEHRSFTEIPTNPKFSPKR